jgi:hypothetical protein
MDGRTTTAVLLLAAAVAIVAVVGVRWAADRSGRREDYTFGPDTVVRCASGHLFMTTWIPLVSVKALRLGAVRIQRCPLCGHAAAVVPVPDSELTPAMRAEAARHRDQLPP